MSHPTEAFCPILLGGPLPLIKVRVPTGMTAATPCYLTLDREDGRRVWLVYEQGNPANDGQYLTVGGVDYWGFEKPAEWTRAGSLPAGVWHVYGYVGALAGVSALPPFKVCTLEVTMPVSGLPLGVLPP